MIISKGDQEYTKNYVIRTILDRKSKNPNYKVIDIGGAVNSWSSPYIDFLVDFNTTPGPNKLSFDICQESEWNALFDLVDREGKFDYCICTQTLEDLYNPITPLKNIPKIAKSGIITMPTAKTELSHISSSAWLGYIHHRWIYDIGPDNSMLVIPKLNFLDALVTNPFEPVLNDIRYEWNDHIPFTIFMDNYLGPDVNTVISKYQEFINRL